MSQFIILTTATTASTKIQHSIFGIPTSVIEKLYYGFLIDLKWIMIDKSLFLGRLIFMNLRHGFLTSWPVAFNLLWNRVNKHDSAINGFTNVIFRFYRENHMTQSVTDWFCSCTLLEAGQQYIWEIKIDSFICDVILYLCCCFLRYSSPVISFNHTVRIVFLRDKKSIQVE